MRFLITILLALAAKPGLADVPSDAVALSPVAALACVTERYEGEVLRIRDDEDGLVQEIRWLTPAGNVLRIDLTGPGCRFLEVDGVGQIEARILPGNTS